MVQDALTQEIERRIEELGFELVDLERVGSRARPILRAYIDRPDSRPGEPGVSLDDCARVSRALEPFLDEREDLSDRYVLEVSSPGVERPLVRRRDWERFAGSEVRVKSKFFAPYTRSTHEPLRWFGGDYDDVVVRTPTGWRFRRRVCTGRWQFTPGEQEELPEPRRTW